jgi:hypothetical protein
MATPNEQALADQLFAKPEPSMGAYQAAKEGIKEFVANMYPGLKDAPKEIWAEAKHQLAQGAHELAAALFNGNAFVMYPRGGKDDHAKDGHGVHGPDQGQDLGHHQGQDQGMQHESPTQQHERGGRSM